MQVLWPGRRSRHASWLPPPSLFGRSLSRAAYARCVREIPDGVVVGQKGPPPLIPAACGRRGHE